MKILHLTLKKKWFLMIASGEKKEEYREIKMFWAVRLMNGFPKFHGIDSLNPDFKYFEVVKFTNGYGSKAPTVTVECKGIDFGFGKTEWGADGNEQFVIKLGKIIQSNL